MINTRDSETIDLTRDSRKTIKESTLLVGSSILKGVQNKNLKHDATVRSFSGATIQSLKSKLQEYDIENCKTIILHVGGNDADNGSDLDSFQDDYIELMDSLASDDRRLIVPGLLSRATVEPYNKQLKLLCDENHVDFIDHYDGFLLASGELPATYFHRDKLHLNVGGTRKLLHNVDRLCKVTGSPSSSTAEPQKHRPRNIVPTERRSRRTHVQTFCHICSMRNHNTYECYFNSRRAGIAGRNAY